jgi:hypothetical protein
MKTYSEDALQSKLINLFPDIRKKNVSLSLNYDKARISWIVRLAKENKEQTLILPAADADTCMTGKFCEPFKTELLDALNRVEGK